MGAPLMHHRSPEFKELVRKAHAGLQVLFQTGDDGQVCFFSSSGTGAMEAAITTTLARHDKALVVRGGKFGDRWVKICEVYGVEAIVYDVDWGHVADPERVRAMLDEHPEIRAVCVQASETSTGVAHPVEAIAGLTADRADTVCLVDGITAVGVTDLPMNKWSMDVLVAGSQKALMLPPGMAMAAMSEKARRASERSNLPKFYLDLVKECRLQAEGTTAFTSPVTLVYGLVEALAMIEEEGLHNVFARHADLAKATREGLVGLGLELLCPDAPSPGVTAVRMPEGVDGELVVKKMREDHAITIAGGQDHLKGKIIRLSHMGWITDEDIEVGLAGLAAVLEELQK